MAASGQLSLERPPCKHWTRRGHCLLAAEGRCFYSHPPDCEAAVAAAEAMATAAVRQAALSAAIGQTAPGMPGSSGDGAGGAGGSGSGGGKGAAHLRGSGARAPRGPRNEDAALLSRGPRRRNRIRNLFRVSVFRSWLLDTFGAEVLGRGSGVLDVAGGKGELAFELLNLNCLPATVLDPRPLKLRRFVRRLKEGFYASSRVFERHNNNNNVPAASSLAVLDVDAGLEGSAAQGAGGDDDGGGGGDARVAQTPGHLRMLLTDQIVEAVARLAQLRREGREGGAEWAAAMAAAVRRVLDSHHRALQMAWTRKGLAASEGHEQGYEQEQEERQPRRPLHQPVGPNWRRRRGRQADTDTEEGEEGEEGEGSPSAGDESGDEADEGKGESGERGGEGGDGRVLLRAVHSDCNAYGGGGDANAGSVPAPSTSPAAQPAAAAAAGAAPAPATASDVSASGGKEEAGAYAGDGDGDAAARCWAEAALRCLLDCSVVVGMHPDQAVEPAARLALAAGKPFALVPCCVYAAYFPHRRLKNGEQVRTYAQLLAYLRELDPAEGAVVARQLPFEGRNVLLYHLALPPPA